MNTVNTHLPLDEQNEDEQVITIGDDILIQFYYGNFTDAISMMIKEYISPVALAEYLEKKGEEYDTVPSELYNGHFTLSYFAEIGASYQSRI